VKQRLAVVEYAIAHGIKPASRRFALERKTIRRWRDRWRAKGLAGLVPRYPAQRASRLQAEVVKLIEHARRELLYGAPRTRVWLRRRHKRNVSLGAIQRTFERLGLPKLPSRSKRRSRPRQLTLFEKPTPGDSVQIDVKVVKVAGRKVFQYTACDDCTRLRVLRCTGGKISGRVWTSSARSSARSRSPFEKCKATTAPNSRSRSH
jgi:transposase